MSKITNEDLEIEISQALLTNKCIRCNGNPAELCKFHPFMGPHLNEMGLCGHCVRSLNIYSAINTPVRELDKQARKYEEREIRHRTRLRPSFIRTQVRRMRRRFVRLFQKIFFR